MTNPMQYEVGNSKKGQTKALKPTPNATFSFYNQEQGRIGIHREMAVDNKALTIVIV